MEWCSEKFMVSNADKCHDICLGEDAENAKFCFDMNTSVNSKEETRLGIIIDNALLFDSHVKGEFKKFSQILVTLSRLVSYLEPKERNLIFSFMIKSQLTSNKLFSKIHECSLGEILNDHEGSFK